MNSISPQMLGLASGDVTLFTGQGLAETVAEERARPVRRLVQMVSRWRWLLLGGVAAGALVGAMATLLMTREYASTARLEISRGSARVVNIDSVQRDISIGDQEFYQTQYGLLRTQVLAERVARDLGVVDDPGFFKMFHRSEAFRSGVNPSTPEARAKRTEIAGQILLTRVGVAPVRGSSLVDIRAVTPDPALSQRIAQAWGQDFIASNLERRFEASSYARKFLETRLDQLREKLEQSERQAVGYAAQHGIINLPSPVNQETNGAAGPRSLITDDLTALNAALESATADRIQAEAKLREARQPDAAGEALNNEAINAMRNTRAEAAAEYDKLMVDFEPDYPEARALASRIKGMDAAIAREEDRVRRSLQQAYAAARAREQALQARVDGLKGDLADLRQRSIQYNIYQRDAETNRELYNALLQRYKEIGVAGGVENNNVAVVDSAKLPDRPASPRLLVNLILSMLAGLVAGAAIGAAREQIDDGITDPEQLEDKLALPLLGVAPRLKAEEPLKALKDPRSKLVESYLALQANLELSTARGTPKSLAVISTRPQEGKSTTTVALAQSLARARRKVVLIDADLRSPSIHAAFGFKNTVGVSSFLSGHADIDAALQPTGHEGLFVMTAGPQPPNAADLLMGERLPELIALLQDRFDHVIVDSPPVIGLADAPLVAAAVEGVIYVVEAKSVGAATVRTALNRLKSGQVHLLGAVLTKFEVPRARLGYGYGYGYGDYGYGYGR